MTTQFSTRRHDEQILPRFVLAVDVLNEWFDSDPVGARAYHARLWAATHEVRIARHLKQSAGQSVRDTAGPQITAALQDLWRQCEAKAAAGTGGKLDTIRVGLPSFVDGDGGNEDDDDDDQAHDATTPVFVGAYKVMRIPKDLRTEVAWWHQNPACELWHSKRATAVGAGGYRGVPDGTFELYGFVDAKQGRANARFGGAVLAQGAVPSTLHLVIQDGHDSSENEAEVEALAGSRDDDGGCVGRSWWYMLGGQWTGALPI